MRPIYLEMVNIGPFVKRTRIELKTIEEDGLFLISGPTGSGKSFIFDAICYSLYGKTPSGRERNMASDHAGPGDRPVIKFCFEVGDERYLVERTLEHEAFKQRGTGTKVEKEIASLSILTENSGDHHGWKKKVLSSGKNDVPRKINGILGLEIEQFARVMMIPQGEFRELLKADTEKREGLLSKLFDSIIYDRIAKGFDQKNKALRKRIAEAGTRSRTVMESIIENLELEEGPGEGITFKDWSDSLMIDLEERLSDVSKKEVNAHNEWEMSLKVLEKARDILRTETGISNTLEKKRIMEEKEKIDIQPLRNKIDLDRKASRFRADVKTIKDATLELKTFEEQKVKFEDRINILEKKHRSEEERFIAELPSKENEISRYHGRIDNLSSFLPSIKEIDSTRKEIQRLSQEKKIAQKDMDDRKKKITELDQNRSNMQKEVYSLSREEDPVALDKIVRTGRDLISIIKEYEKVQGDVARVKEGLEALKTTFKKSETTHKELMTRRESSIAGELAQSLETGRKCPVCGSKDHPSPRKTSSEDVTSAMIKRSFKGVESRRKELKDAQVSLAELETRLNGLSKRRKNIVADLPMLGEKDERSLTEIISDHQERINISRERDEKEKVLKKGLQSADIRLRELREGIEPISLKLNEVRTELAAQRSRLDERKRSVIELDFDMEAPDLAVKILDEIHHSKEKARGLKTSIETERETLKQMELEIERLTGSCKNIISSIAGLKEKVSRSERDILTVLRETHDEDLRTIHDVEAALMDEGELIEMNRIVKGHDEKMVSCLTTLKDLEEHRTKLGTDLDITDGDDLKFHEDMERELKEVWESLNKRKAAIEKDLDYTRRQLETIQRTSKEMERIDKELRTVGRVTDQVRGLSTPRMSLERFFLSQRFEEVLVSSNQRLKELSGGRFHLSRADEMEQGKRAKVGLDLNVYDNYTGQERPANTLSGGQMFLSSLALALGLADVVQSRSGGIRMDALFIDEGFGSLDEETLQIALKVLSELREGRMVGVISHVGELKRQIRTGFEVEPSPSGSIIRTIHG